MLALDALLEPTPFVAVTVNVYVVPLVKPVTVQGLDALEQVLPSGDDVTVNCVIGSPLAPAPDQVTVA